MARYFVHFPPNGSPAIFWRKAGGFAHHKFHYNLNLLAHAVGDIPPRRDMVAAQDYNFGGLAPVRVQPFARSAGFAGPPTAIPIGPKLSAFLDDPLEGHRMDLSLPFYDEQIKLGPKGGGFFRKNDDEGSYHGGTDFSTGIFDVCAAADGKVLAMDDENGDKGAAIVLSHFTPAGKEFRTIYQHLDVTTSPSEIKKDAAVRRGQFLGRVIGKPPAVAAHIVHLHFGVAVQGEKVTLNNVEVPKLWYFIDPWGVYDYYEHDDTTNSTYLPPDSQPNIFQSMIAGAVHTIQWRTQPLFKTIPIARTTEGYKEIVRIQLRVRKGENSGGTLPDEHEQFLVWLKDDPDFFLVPLSLAKDSTAELELVTMLREAFLHTKSVRLEYRYAGDLRYIMAAWVGR